jgi:hypothetical protein
MPKAPWLALLALAVLLLVLVFAWLRWTQLVELVSKVQKAIKREERMPDSETTTNSQSASSMGSAHDRQNRIDVKTAAALAYITTCLFFALVFIIILHGVGPKTERLTTGPTPSRDLLFTLLGVVATGWATIVGYYYGSSSGSAQKSLALAQALAEKGERGTPLVQAITPNPLTRAPAAQRITIQGQNLDAVKSVQLSPPQGRPVDATIVNVSSTSITCEVLVSDPVGEWDLHLFEGISASGTATHIPKALKVQ